MNLLQTTRSLIKKLIKCLEITVSRNTLYQEAITLERSWSFSYDVYPRGTIHGWTNIIRMGTGLGNGGYGGRLPAIFFISDSTRNGLYNEDILKNQKLKKSMKKSRVVVFMPMKIEHVSG